MKTKKLALEEMVKTNGGTADGDWTDCASFAISAVSMATGVSGILGLAGMALSAGACEAYLDL